MWNIGALLPYSIREPGVEFFYKSINVDILSILILHCNIILLDSLHYEKSALTEFLAEAFQCHVHH